MSNSYLYRMPAGIAGAISRPRETTTEPVMLNTSKTFTAYGLAGKYSNDEFVPLESGDAASVIAGILVRPYPTTSQPDREYILKGEYATTGDNLKRGYINVKVADATALTKGAPVYVRNANPTDDSPLGSILTTSTDAVLLEKAYFTGAGDANGNTEIAYNL